MTVNADDLGLDESTSRAILEAFKKNYISSSTLMVNMPYAEAAADLVRTEGLADRIGLHLNITAGEPLSEGIRNNPLICGNDGVFNAAFYHTTKYRLYMDDLTIRQIKDEFRAQIERFLSFGFKELHIDSHHHVHTNYPVYRALKQLSAEYDLKYVRLSRNMYHGGSIPNRVYKFFYNKGIEKLSEEHTDLFGSFTDLFAYINGDENALRALIDKKNIEVMVHPMYKDGILYDTDTKMEDEWRLLCHAQG